MATKGAVAARKAARRAAQGPRVVTRWVKGPIYLDAHLEADRPGGSDAYPGYTHLEVRLHQRMGVPLEDAPDLAADLHALVAAAAPPAMTVVEHGGTARVYLPIPAWGTAVVWCAGDTLILRTYFADVIHQGPSWWTHRHQAAAAALLSWWAP